MAFDKPCSKEFQNIEVTLDVAEARLWQSAAARSEPGITEKERARREDLLLKSHQLYEAAKEAYKVALRSLEDELPYDKSEDHRKANQYTLERWQSVIEQHRKAADTNGLIAFGISLLADYILTSIPYEPVKPHEIKSALRAREAEWSKDSTDKAQSG